ncbi:uncharacterized protein DEA37_0014478 [Paragonimus westermani]|uniref:Trafficking protein particle complex subunit 9 n=1 Tax=Paragonimus westermani TaxID=34504 RepID=A0A5J4NFK5_9TREM|nr:uncharacterized protein DEA37_0014478 [Paragonimus westermani]
MFTVDYHQQLADHGKVLVLVKNFEPACKAELFHQTFVSIASHHALIYPKQSVSRLTNLHFNRVRNESLMDLPSDIHSDMSSNNMVRDQPIWMRYVRDLCSFNTAWASFQSHRAVLGLIGFCCCTNQDQMVPAIQAYLQQKALISETPINGRFFILIPTTDQTNSTLSIEEANEIILAECKKLPQSLLLTTDEILAHPAEQVFNTDILSLRQSSCDLLSVDSTDPSSLANLTSFQTQSTSSHAAILNPRLVGALTELASNIYRSLEKLVLTQDPKSAKISALGNIDISDNDSSESGIGGLSLPVETATSKSTESGSSDEHRFISKPYTGSVIADGPGTSPVQTDSGSVLLFTVVIIIKVFSVAIWFPRKNFRPLTKLLLSSLFSVNKHRKLTAQRNKHLGDVCLQMGELDLAQFYYETALQLLRPLMVHLWIAGAMEGLCAVAVARYTYRSKNVDLLNLSRRSLRHKALANGAPEKAVSKSTDFSTGMDVASQKVKQTSSHFTSSDLCGNALEALEMYKKAQIDVGLLEETAFKVAHLLVSEKQNAKACELLDSLHVGTFDDRIDMTVNQAKRLSALVGLYRDLGYVRRASLVAWQAFGQNIKLPTVNEFDILFTSLYINVISSALLNESESYEIDSSSRATDKSHSQTKRAVTPTTLLRRPAIPTSLSPVVRQHRSAWYPGSTGPTQLRIIRSTTGANRYKRAGRNPRPNKSSVALEHSDFHHIGWSQLQAAVLWQIVESYKMEVKFDDATEISWDRGLQLIGFIFSLLDAWPCQLNKTQCASFMEDVCRLAVFRSPDQPRIAPNTIFPFKTDISGNVERYVRSRHGVQMTMAQNDEDESLQKRPIALRQLVDLIEIPVHQLPAFQSICLLPLPAYLLPNELSKDGLASAVPLSSLSPSSNCSDLKPSETSFLANSGARPSRLFEYAPTDSETLGTGGFGKMHMDFPHKSGDSFAVLGSSTFYDEMHVEHRLFKDQVILDWSTWLKRLT